VKLEQLDTPDGVVLRSSPTPKEWQRSRARLVGAAAGFVAAGAGVTVLELRAGPQLLLLELLPLLVGLTWAARLVPAVLAARPTAVVVSSHSLRLERLDGSSQQSIDLAGVSAIRIGPEGFSRPWRWMKGPREGLVMVKLRASGQSLGIPPELAGHPVVRQLLARALVASRANGPVVLAGPRGALEELDRLAADPRLLLASAPAVEIPPITIPAGWYADPGGQAALRWWDGREWTGHTKGEPDA
jgi:hypothetical protein